MAGMLRAINHPGVTLDEEGLPNGEMKGPEVMTPILPHVGLDRAKMLTDEFGLRAFARLCVRAGAIDVETVTEELTASWFGWPVRTFEAAVKPGALGWGWSMFAYKGWLALSAFDERVSARLVPQQFFYNVSVTGVKPPCGAP